LLHLRPPLNQREHTAEISILGRDKEGFLVRS